MHELKDKVASKWCNLQEKQAKMCTMLEEVECQSRKDYEERVIESMAKMTSYLASEHVPEVKLQGSNPPVSQSPSQVQVKLPKINLPTFDRNVLSWQPYCQSSKSFGSGQSVIGKCPKIRVFDEIAKGFGC